jgi:hypothetical protein
MQFWKNTEIIRVKVGRCDSFIFLPERRDARHSQDQALLVEAEHIFEVMKTAGDQ